MKGIEVSMLEISSLRDLFAPDKQITLDSLPQTLTRRAIHQAPVVETLVKGLNNRLNPLGATLVLLTLSFVNHKQVMFATTCDFSQKVWMLF
jgi:hypothetical protein